MDEPKTTTPMPTSAHEPVRRVGPPPPGEQPAMLIDHATKRFMVGRKKKPVVAVNDVTMSIRRGEIYGILGANGSGKSTLIRLISTLLTIDGGRIEVFGHDVERDEMAV
ncbi:MAG: ATP-binding cassette domain-containing protein, partial [Candidatus Limnocylindria bacterium]